jgi:hypothetical protein
LAIEIIALIGAEDGQILVVDGCLLER